MSTAQTELRRKQIEQAEELLFSGPQKAGFAKDLFFGRFRSESILSVSRAPPGTGSGHAAGGRRGPPIRSRSHRRRPHRPRIAAFPTKSSAGWADRRAGHVRLAPLRRTRFLAAAVLPHHGGDRRPLRRDDRLRQRPSLDRPAVARTLRHDRAEGALAAPRSARAKRSPPSRSPSRRPAPTPPTSAPSPTPTPTDAVTSLNGTKRYITNGAIAGVLTVMARTPDPKEPDGKVTAFLVTPDMPGFEVLEARMDKVGIRGTATARLAFNDMFVPKENILGRIRQGTAAGAHRPRLRPHDLRGKLHRRGQVLRPGSDEIRQRAAAVRQDARRIRAGPRKDRAGGRRDVRDGKRHLSHGGPHRHGGRGLHARNVDDQALRQRFAVADRQRHAANPRRQPASSPTVPSSG